MGKDFGSWLPQCQIHNAQPSGPSFNLGLQSIGVPSTAPCASTISTHGTLPVFESSGLPGSEHGWHDFSPRFTQGLNSTQNMVFNEILRPTTNFPGSTGSGGAPKQFLVFDQIGNKTTLIFSSGIGTPLRDLTSWIPKPTVGGNFSEDDFGTHREGHYYSAPNLINEFNKDYGTNDMGEMHEDTEEINALLYSDDVNDEDDEVTSTGHSPSSMTAYAQRDWIEEDIEEVASSIPPAKRQKLSDGSYEIAETATSSRPGKSSENENDAESICVGEIDASSDHTDSSSGSKRTRKERIQDIVGVLQTIIPGGKGKDDAVMVLDEAIHYLKSLKLKAISLGLHAI